MKRGDQNAIKRSMRLYLVSRFYCFKRVLYFEFWREPAHRSAVSHNGNTGWPVIRYFHWWINRWIDEEVRAKTQIKEPS